MLITGFSKQRSRKRHPDGQRDSGTESHPSDSTRDWLGHRVQLPLASLKLENVTSCGAFLGLARESVVQARISRSLGFPPECSALGTFPAGRGGRPEGGDGDGPRAKPGVGRTRGKAGPGGQGGAAGPREGPVTGSCFPASPAC